MANHPNRSKTISPAQIEALRRGAAVGCFDNGKWVWFQGDVRATPAVRSLIRRGLMRVTKERRGLSEAEVSEAGCAALATN